MVWNKDLPAGGAAFNVGDDAIRRNNVGLESGLHNEHEFSTGGVQNCIHKFTYDNKAAMDAISGPVDGSIAIRSDAANPGIHAYDGSTWDQVATLIPASTAMVFHQAAAPNGWVADETRNDHMLHVVTVASGTGGTVLTDSQWFVDEETDSHVLTEAEIPAHTHSYTSALLDAGATAALTATGGGANASSSTGDGGGHAHILSGLSTWRPLSTDVIICTKAASTA